MRFAGPKLRGWTTALCVAAACLGAAASAEAGSTEPDNLFLNGGNAFPFSSQTFAATGNMATAGEEANENNHAGYTDFQGSLWWEWTAPSNQRVRVQTCNLVQFNSIVAVYRDQGEVAFPLTDQVAVNDDGCASQSRLAFTPIQGETYFIAITKRDTTNALTYEWSLRPTPSNDLLANAEVLPATPPISVAGNSQGATAEPNENAHAGNTDVSGGASIWYSWTPTASAEVTVDTCSSQVTDTRVGIYEAAGAFPLTEVASADGGCGGGFGGAVVFDAVAAETYLIAVDGGENFPNEEAQEGPIDLDIVATPTNDDFADAQAVSGELPLLNTSGNSNGATAEPLEPQHAGAGAASSVWYSWAPQAPGAVTVDTCESDFNTRLAVYTGSALSNLQSVASDGDSCGTGGTRSRLSFTASAPTYWIAVDIGNVDGGAVDLDIEEFVPDTVDPTVTIDSSSINKPKGKAAFTFSGTDDVSPTAELTFACRIDSKPEQACTSPQSYKKLKKGKHTFRVYSTDEAGNDSPVAEQKFKSRRKP